MELVPRSANVSQTLADRITNPLSCSSIMDKLTRRRDADYDPGSGGPGAGNYIPTQPIQSVNVATAVQSKQVNTQNSSDGYTKQSKMSLKEAAVLVFNLIKIPPVVNFLPLGWFSPSANSDDDYGNIRHVKDVTEDVVVKDVTVDVVVRKDVTEDIIVKPDDSPALCE